MTYDDLCSPTNMAINDWIKYIYFYITLFYIKKPEIQVANVLIVRYLVTLNLVIRDQDILRENAKPGE